MIPDEIILYIMSYLINRKCITYNKKINNIFCVSKSLSNNIFKYFVNCRFGSLNTCIKHELILWHSYCFNPNGYFEYINNYYNSVNITMDRLEDLIIINK